MTPAQLTRLRHTLMLSREGMADRSGYRPRQIAAFELGSANIPKRAALAFIAVAQGFESYDDTVTAYARQQMVEALT